MLGDKNAEASYPIGNTRRRIPNAFRKASTLFILAVSMVFAILYYMKEYNGSISIPFSGARNPLSKEVTSPQSKTMKADKRLNAAFIVLVRNSELIPMKNSMRQLESRFNHRYQYPWILLNDEPFSETFKKEVSQMTDAKVTFGLVPQEHWSYPGWISQTKAAEVRNTSTYMYGSLESYRHMCRFQSGFFFRHPSTLHLDYYWRVEPGVEFTCDIHYDPFAFMASNNKSYGFNMAVPEMRETVPTLYDNTKEFFQQHPEYISQDSALHFLTGEKTITPTSEALQKSQWNLCHYWSNFEIGDMKFFRSKAYLDYFDHLDRAGGFYYERWGDAPIHSLAASIMLDKSQIHYFEDIGYKHDRWDHCPSDPSYFKLGQCSCDPTKTFDTDPRSCIKQYKIGQDVITPSKPLKRSRRSLK